MLRSRHCELHELVTVTVTDSVINLGFLAPRGVRLRTNTSYTVATLGAVFAAPLILWVCVRKGYDFVPIRSFVSESCFCWHDLHVWYINALSFLSLQCREKKEKESEPKLRPTDQIQSAAIH